MKDELFENWSIGNASFLKKACDNKIAVTRDGVTIQIAYRTKPSFLEEICNAADL